MPETSGLNPALKSALESKLARYALAGGALLGLPAAGHAGAVYSGPQNLSFGIGTPISVNFNPLVDAIDDFTFSIVDSFPVLNFFANGGTNAVNVGPLSLGDPITLANTTATGSQTLLSAKCCTTLYGPWASQGTTPAYIGVRFTASGQDYLGWAQLSLNLDALGAQGTVIDWAYEDTPNTSINAGAGAGSPVPEPSSLALFAMGAAGVLALLRRRKAA